MLSQNLRKIDKPVEDFDLKNHAAWRTPSKLKKNEWSFSEYEAFDEQRVLSIYHLDDRLFFDPVLDGKPISLPSRFGEYRAHVSVLDDYFSPMAPIPYGSEVGKVLLVHEAVLNNNENVENNSDKNSICGSIGQIYICCVNSTRHLFSMVFIVLTFDFCILKQILLAVRFYTKTRTRTMQRREVRCLIGQIISHCQIVIISFY